MLNFIKLISNYLYNFLFKKQLFLLKFIIIRIPRLKKRYIRKLKIKFWIVIDNINNPKKFYKYWISFCLLILFRASPTNVKWLLIKILCIFISMFRSSFFLLKTANFNHKDSFNYLIFSLLFFILIKFFQEVYYNFTCPLATFLYGKFKPSTREYAHLKKKKERELLESKRKLHKFVADPFFTKEQKRKRQADKDKKEAEKSIVVFARFEKKKTNWPILRRFYLKLHPKKRLIISWHRKYFKHNY